MCNVTIVNTCVRGLPNHTDREAPGYGTVYDRFRTRYEALARQEAQLERAMRAESAEDRAILIGAGNVGLDDAAGLDDAVGSGDTAGSGFSTSATLSAAGFG